jgi:GT2 family glycosyltransferase
MTAGRISLVVSTIGRVPELLRLVRSVEAAEGGVDVEVVLVDQSADERCIAALTEASPSLRWLATTSGRGVSLGRNVGLGLATGDVVAFPNDNTWYPPDSLAKALELLGARPEVSGLSGRLLTGDGRPAMLRWPAHAQRVDRRNFHRTAISPSLFLRRSVVDELGGFDEMIGTGAAGPAQAGEESDLVLRAIATGHLIDYEPSLTVHNAEPRDAADQAFVVKMRGYGYGHGHVWRMHALPVHRLVWTVVRKCVAAVVRAASRRSTLAHADLAWARACLVGYVRGGRR